MIIIICGLPGSGKTTLAKSLASLMKISVLSTDKIRKELFSQPSYSREERELIFDIMILIAKYLHQARQDCILDATFNLEKSRIEVKESLSLQDNEFKIIECNCPEDIILSRLRSRKDEFSDADVSIYFKMKKIYQPVQIPHIDVDTSKDPISNAKIILDKINDPLSYH